MKAITRTLKLKAAPETVWKALTESEELGRWFPDAGAKLDLRPGGRGWFGWEHYGRFAVRVESVEPQSRISWRWARQPDTPIENGPSTLVEWKLTPTDNGGTLLELRESGFEKPKDREENEEGWTAELKELVALLEG
jgi:uncharacterized protein YndB with AHSA1/START domain